MSTPTALDIAYATVQAAIAALRDSLVRLDAVEVTSVAAARDALDAIEAACARALELAYLRVKASPGEPHFPWHFSGGPPEEPTRPIDRELMTFRAHDVLAPLVDAIDGFLAALIYDAECSEWTEASLNATQLLVGAQLVAVAARTHVPAIAHAVGAGFPRDGSD